MNTQGLSSVFLKNKHNLDSIGKITYINSFNAHRLALIKVFEFIDKCMTKDG